MLGVEELLTGTPFIVRAAVGAVLWVISILILILHRSGAQIVGAVFVLTGALAFVAGANPHLTFLMVVFGFIVHSLGRVMHWMRRR